VFPDSPGPGPDAAQGELEAEGAELADVMGDLPAEAGPAVVVVRAEVLMAHAGTGQQLVVDLQLGAADGDLALALPRQLFSRRYGVTRSDTRTV
jgi:hypothetical protein